ncbi:MAG: hypothetical protein KGZ89_04890 [Actinobacteria bacterium]|nr:hypothetical protein [Actinomycetota bacterium]
MDTEDLILTYIVICAVFGLIFFVPSFLGQNAWLWLNSRFLWPQDDIRKPRAKISFSSSLDEFPFWSILADLVITNTILVVLCELDIFNIPPGELPLSDYIAIAVETQQLHDPEHVMVRITIMATVYFIAGAVNQWLRERKRLKRLKASFAE